MKRRSLTSKDWQSHIDSWKNSGLSQESYCKQADISYATFSKWRSRLKKSAVTQSTHSFVEATPHRQDSIGAGSLVLQVVLPNGTRFGLSSQAPKELFEQVLLLASQLQCFD